MFIQNCNVTFWRGTWTALDLLLFPDDFELSAIVSLGVACCLAVIFYVTQFHIAVICKYVDKQWVKIYWNQRNCLLTPQQHHTSPSITSLLSNKTIENKKQKSHFISRGGSRIPPVLLSTIFLFQIVCTFPENSTILSLVKQLLLDVVFLAAGVCAVCFWRGVWYLWDVYLWPEEPVQECLVHAWVG